MKEYSVKTNGILWLIILCTDIIATMLWYKNISDSNEFAISVLRDDTFVESWGIASLCVFMLGWWLERERKTHRPYLICAIVFMPLLMLFWQIANCCSAALLPCLLYTLVFVLLFVVAIGEKGVLKIINPTHYAYFDRTSFYFPDSRKPGWYEKEEFAYEKINKLIDSIIVYCNSELNGIANNSALSELIYYARTTRCALSQWQLNETLKRLDEILEKKHLPTNQILDIFEIKALLRISNNI